jgi:hypothetical protein
MYTLSYVKKTSGLSEKERTRWISAIGDAYIFQKTGK